MPESTVTKFYEELKRRRVIRVATLYVVAVWPIIQLLDIISPTLDLPDAVLRYLVIAFFSGLPFTILLAWIFDSEEDDLDADKHQTSLLGSKTDLKIVGSLCLLVVALFVIQLGVEEDVPAPTDLDLVVETNTETSTNTNTNTNLEGQTPSKTSIAVKPFDSFSVEPRDQFFADGLSEELLNVLAGVPELRVAARTSSFAYKGVNRHISEIGRELNVANILEGSVRVNDIDNTIRVTAQLIDVASGEHLWSQTYTRPYNDVFQIQDDISAAVADRLKVELTGVASPSLRTDVVRSTNPDVLIAYGRGQQELSKRTKEGFLAAAQFFSEAINEDPNFALAYAGLSDTLTLTVSYEYGDKTADLEKAQIAVDKALSLDPELGIAWASRGLLESQFPDRMTEAKQSLEKAMDLNPSYAMAVMWYASLVKDPEEVVNLYERAVELDPKSPVAAYNLARKYLDQGRENEVMTLFSQMVEADPNYPKGYELVSEISARNGQIGEAIVYAKKAHDLGGDLGLALNIAKMYSELGDFENSDLWFSASVDQVPPEYIERVNWLRLGRFISGGQQQIAEGMLADMGVGPFVDLEDDYNKILSNYYLGNNQEVISDYEATLKSSKTFAHADEYANDLHSFVLIAVADRMMAEKMPEQANQLLDTAEAMINKKFENHFRNWPEDRYNLARISAVRGEQQIALIQLQRAVDEGWREHWRPLSDPAMRSLHSSQVFITMMAGLENRLAIIRDQLEREAEFAMGL